MKMHLLPSRYAVARFKLVSWVVIFIFLMIPSTFGVIAYSVAEEDHEFMEVALACIGLTVIAMVILGSVSSRACCPVCHGKTVSYNACTKHGSARRFLGSHRLRVACTVIFRKYFSCPYCGEKTAVQARTRPLPRLKYH